MTEANATITWLGQAGYLVRLPGGALCIDPYLSHSVEQAEGLRRLLPIPVEPERLHVDWVICTHDHLDHLDEATLSRLPDATTRFAGPDSCIDHLLRMGLSPERLVAFNRGDSFAFADGTLTATFADHTKDSIGLLLARADQRLYISGDTRRHDALDGIATLRPTAAIVCINGKLGNMTAEEAAGVCRLLDVAIAIPNHYGMFAENTEDPAVFEQALRGSGIRVRELPFHQPVALNSL